VQRKLAVQSPTAVLVGDCKTGFIWRITCTPKKIGHNLGYPSIPVRQTWQTCGKIRGPRSWPSRLLPKNAKAWSKSALGLLTS
jgi:hypothetical protein